MGLGRVPGKWEGKLTGLCYDLGMHELDSDGILSYDQYAEAVERGIDLPYIIEIKVPNQKLLFYGSEHTSDPGHPQFRDLEERWGRFIAETDQSIVLVEGQFDEAPPEQTRERLQSIVDGGEAQFMVYLARRDGIGVISPEPDKVWEANRLAEEFGRNAVTLYYLVRLVGWRSGSTDISTIKAEAARMLKIMQETHGWDDVDFGIEGMGVIHEQLFGKPFSWNDSQWNDDITAPTSVDHVTNRISRRSGDLRDRYILGQIERYWRAGKSPFTVFGSSHAIRLEPALRKLI